MQSLTRRRFLAATSLATASAALPPALRAAASPPIAAAKPSDPAARGIAPTVADARFAKPLDRDLILRLAREHEALITIEEGAIGGFGSHVAQLLAEEGIFDRGLKFRSMVLPDVFIDQASPEAMYAGAGMNAAQIEAKVLSALGVAVVGLRA